MSSSACHMCRNLAIRLLIAVCAVGCVVVSTSPEAIAKTSPAKKKTARKKAEPVRSTGDVRKEKQRTEKEIAETKKKISENKRTTQQHLDNLNDINSRIERQESAIADLTRTISDLDSRSAVLRDSIIMIKARDSLLCRQIAEGLRHAHVQRSLISPLAFITRARSMNEAGRRLNCLNVLQRARNRRVAELRRQRKLLSDTRMHLDSVQVYHSAAVKQLSTANDILDSRRRESARAVNDLKREGASLNKILEEKKKLAGRLDAELNRIIAEQQRLAEQEAKRKQQEQKKLQEQKKKDKAAQQAKQQGAQPQPADKKPADKKPETKKTAPVEGQAVNERVPGGSFAQNKGRLLFPVAGKYTIVGTFGRSRHDDLDHVQVDNSGIDISVAAGTKARSVFDGTVSSIFFMDGFENIVIIRHGEYLTVYAGLSAINVTKGDRVKAGAPIGTIATVDGRTVLHFEVRKERTKLNPLQWVK